MIIYSGTQCAKVSGGAVTATGRFAALIAPTSPLSGGISEADAKTRFGVYPQQRHASTATHKVVDATPWYDSEADAVYSTTLEVSTLAERKAAMLSALRARFRVVRDLGTTVDFGSGPVPIQTTEGAGNNIQRLHDDLRLREVVGAVNPTQDIATANYDIVPGVTIAAAGAMREAVAAHWRATWARDAALGAAINAAADDAALDLIDVQAGTVDGAGGWPT